MIQPDCSGDPLPYSASSLLSSRIIFLWTLETRILGYHKIVPAITILSATK
jgi:hypothetical protein